MEHSRRPLRSHSPIRGQSEKSPTRQGVKIERSWERTLKTRIDFESLDPYEYRPLKDREIRLLRILPGEFNDDLEVYISHVPLVEPDRARDTRLDLERLQDTLPKGWKVFKTVEERYIFWNRTNRTTHWSHPDQEFDRRLYHSDAVLNPYPGFEPVFEALSYCWGNEEATSRLYVMPHDPASKPSSLHLRPNLDTALKSLRQTQSERILWVDALSINQEDMDERSHQVKKMANIYSLAYRVVVWLGPAAADGSSRQALALLESLGGKVERTRGFTLLPAPASFPAPNFWSPNPIDLFEPLKVLDSKVPLPLDEGAVLAIRRCLERPWWDRLWIWQEIGLASSRSTIQLGSYSALWPMVRRAINVLSWRCESQSGGLLPKLLLSTRSGFADVTPRSSMADIIWRTRKAECSEKCTLIFRHDRIFALFGLVPPTFVNLVQADYSIPVANIFTNVCLAMQKHDKRLDFLTYCDITDEDRDTKKPSWVPNWLKNTERTRLLPSYASGYVLGTSAVSSLGQEHSLTLHRCLSGKVNADLYTTTIRTIRNLRSLVSSVEQPILELWQGMAKISGTNSKCETWVEDFVDTLRCGEINEKSHGSRHPRISECMDKYVAEGAASICSSSVRGRSFFRLTDGHFGLGSPSVATGDIVAIILGCYFPVLLRPSSDRGITCTYRVVGTAYIGILMNTEALLGPIPLGYQVFSQRSDGHWIQAFRHSDSERVVYDDPRLGPLPEGWGFYRGYEGKERARRLFRNKAAGKVTWHDPRLTVGELKKRGAPVQEISLV
ncbi:HET-domain-containing protein [Melanomma pulvis-pyrius CBS 109.77]|uniref:HET-domain-containing protein n=1 Tax=Melanomma pulvis-pyrius CBS 109.77 TaxID=1314802 RepID=A0A6A6X2X0_9PLEO|nr:HET-domain-containing protein [Melanomma pulvis-pyrius CBS 109.77]